MTTQTDDAINCFIEELKLTQDYENCPIMSSAGNLGNNSQAAVSIHNHMTVVWDNALVKHQKECEVVELTSEQEYQYGSISKGTIRIQDTQNQIEYFATKPQIMPCNQRHVLQLTTSAQFFIQVVPVLKNLPKERSEKPNQTQDPKEAAILANLQSAAHMQFIRDLIKERENILATEIENLECQIILNQHLKALSTARSDGWLAANFLELPLCQKIISTGNCESQAMSADPSRDGCTSYNLWTSTSLPELDRSRYRMGTGSFH